MGFLRNREPASRADTDQRMMARSVELGRQAAREGEYPFGSVIAFGDEIIAEGANQTKRDKDESRHAEIIAIAMARVGYRGGGITGKATALASLCIGAGMGIATIIERV